METNTWKYYLRNCTNIKKLTFLSVFISIFYAFLPLFINIHLNNYAFIVKLILAIFAVEIIRCFLISIVSCKIIDCTRNYATYVICKKNLNNIGDKYKKIDLLSYNLIDIFFIITRYIPLVVIAFIVYIYIASIYENIYLGVIILFLLITELFIYKYTTVFNKWYKKYIATKDFIYFKLAQKTQTTAIEIESLQQLEKKSVFYSNIKSSIINIRTFILVIILYIINDNMLQMIYSIYIIYSISKIFTVLQNISNVNLLKKSLYQ